MGDFLRVILDSISYLWPFRLVQEYERGVYYFCGKRVVIPRWLGGPDCRPGIPWIVLPFFCEVKTITVVRDTIVTPIQSITIRDGSILTFSASAQIEVDSADAAYNKVNSYAQTVSEDLAAVLAEKLAEVEPERLAPEVRGRLIGACKQSVGAAVGVYGVRVLSIRFNNFVRNARVYRLFNEQSYSMKSQD